MANTNEESVTDAQRREENARIYKALSGLRKTNLVRDTGLSSNVSSTGLSNETRTWGSVQFNYPSEQSEARIHAVLKPFLHMQNVSSLNAKLQSALFRLGMLPCKNDEGVVVCDVYEARGAVEGVKSVQLFIEGSTLHEYLLIS